MNLDQILALLKLEVGKSRDMDEQRLLIDGLADAVGDLCTDEIAEIVARATQYDQKDFAKEMRRRYKDLEDF